MTIDSNLSRVRYVGNGITTSFSIPFPYLTNNDGTAQLAIYVGDSDTPLKEGVDYTIVGLGQAVAINDDTVEYATYETRFDGGDVIFELAPEQGVPVAVVRNVPQTQGVVFVNGEKFPAHDFENALDKLTMEVQEVKENLQRAIVLPPTSTEKPIEIRDEILVVSKQAKETADEAIVLVNEAKDTIVEETQAAVNTVVNETQNAVNVVTQTTDKAVGDINNTAEQASEFVVENVEKARIWAEGEQSEVKPLGGELSSMGAADLAYAIANAPEDTPIDASGLFAMNVVKGEKGDKGDKGEDGKDGGGLEIGDVAFAVMGIDETKNLRRYLNGQVISQSQFVSFTNWVKERAKLYPNTVATEENWQAEVTNSKLGQCGKFVIGEGTIRLPKVVNIQGLQDLALMGSVKAESLPNITGEWTWADGSDASGRYNTVGNNATLSGAFTELNSKKSREWGVSIGAYEGGDLGFDASLSSSTYQDNAPVQQEAIQYPYFIQVATGTEESVDVTREIELNNPFSLLDYKWSEYELSNASWLISNGAFHSGATYKAVYELLLKIKNGTETKDGVSVKLSTEAYEDTDFVINTADTTFRLPVKVKLASGSAVCGNGMTLGVTDGSGNFGVGTNGGQNGTYAFMCYNQIGENVGNENGNVASSTKNKLIGVTTDPTKSGIETSSSGLKLYFYVGETIQDANVIAASQVLTAVADCVRKSSATDRETVVGWGMPDYTAGVSVSSNFTAPSDGFYIGSFSNDNNCTFSVNGTAIMRIYAIYNNHHGFVIPLSKGDVLTASNWTRTYSNFFPLKGVI